MRYQQHVGFAVTMEFIKNGFFLASLSLAFDASLQAHTTNPNCETQSAAAPAPAVPSLPSLTERLQVQAELSQKLYRANILPSGLIWAAQSEIYQAQWKRDAALTLMWVLHTYKNAEPDSAEKTWAFDTLMKNLKISRLVQILPGVRAGIATAKVKSDANGLPIALAPHDPWADHQMDGPATEAIWISEFLLTLHEEGWSTETLRDTFFRDPAYLDPSPAFTLKENLNYLIGPEFFHVTADIWEETFADSHFYTLLSMRRALELGERVAHIMGDTNYLDKLRNPWRSHAESPPTQFHPLAHIAARLRQHEDPQNGSLTAHYRVRNTDHFSDKSAIDIQTVLGALYFGNELKSVEYSVADPRMVATMGLVLQQSRQLFPDVNQNARENYFAPLVMRYMRDDWDGETRKFDKRAAHPWALATAAAAEYDDRYRRFIQKKGEVEISAAHLNYFEALFPERVAEEIRNRITAETHFILKTGEPLFIELVACLRQRGDRFRERILDYANDKVRAQRDGLEVFVPGTYSGNLPEQMHKTVAGLPQGPMNLTWSHIAFLRSLESRSQ